MEGLMFWRRKKQPPPLDDEACREHQDRNCQTCQRYRLVLVTWQDRRVEQTFWLGQKAGIEWGPMGLSDMVYVEPVAKE